MLLLIDNYDSFTWNLVQAFAALGVEVEVARNDALTVAEALARAPSGLVLGAGPGRPSEAGICPELLRRAPASLPVLGVCLGHQALVEHYSGELELDPVPMHGRTSPIHHDSRALFTDLPNPFPAGRYHSLRATRTKLPPTLTLCAWTPAGHVMAVRHQSLPRFGLQFHPESILTPLGPTLLANFAALCHEPSDR